MAASISLLKTSKFIDTNGDSFADLNEGIEYTFTITNTSSSGESISNLKIDDPNLGIVDLLVPGTLAPGESVKITSNYTIKAEDLDAGQVENSATAIGTANDGTTVTAVGSNIQGYNVQAGLDLTKVADAILDTNGSGRVDAGDTIRYQYTVTNNSPRTALNLELVDDNGTLTDPSDDVTLPLTGLTNEDGGATANDLRIDGKATAFYDYTIKQADIDRGFVRNNAVASGVTRDNVLIDGSESRTVNFNRIPGIEVVKTAGPISDTNGDGVDSLGDQIQYNYIVTNTGNVTLTNVTLIDDNGTATTADDVPITLTKTTLAPNESTTGTFTGQLTQAAIDAGQLTNIATATGTTPPGTSPRTVTDTDTETVVPTAAPEIDLVKTAGDIVNTNGNTLVGDAGDTVIYSYIVKNTGNVTLSNVTVKDDNGTPGDASDDFLVTLGLTTLQPGQSTTGQSASVPLTQQDVDTGSVTNIAIATGQPPRGNPVTDDAQAIVTTNLPGQIQLRKTAGAIVDVNSNKIFGDAGDTVTYSYEVTNIGPVTLNNLVLRDDNGTVADLSDDFNVTLAATLLAPGASTTGQSAPIPFTQSKVDAGTVTNTAKVTGTDPKGNSVEDTDTATVTLNTPGEIKLQKTAGAIVDANNNQIIGDAGDTVIYSYEVTNPGPVTLSNLVLRDDNGTPTDLLDDFNVTLGSTTLVPGASTTGQSNPIPFTQAKVDAGSVTNIAKVTATDPKGNSLIAEDEATVPISLPPEIAITKTAGAIVDANNNGFVGDVGDTVVYSYTVTNTGRVSLLDVVLNDDNGTPSDSSDDFSVTLSGQISDLNGNLIPDLEVGNVATGQSVPIALSATDIAAGEVTNIAKVTATDSRGNPVTAQDEATVGIPRPKPPEIKLVKTAGEIQNHDCDPHPSPGDTVKYTYEVTNIGEIPLFNLKLIDDNGTPSILSDDFEIKIEGLADLDQDGQFKDLAAGDKAVGYYTKTLTAEDICNCIFTNVGTVEGFSSTGEKATASDAETIVFCPPDIQLEKCAELDLGCDHVLNAGDVVNYYFQVKNTGKIALDEIFIDDPMLAQKNVTIEFTNNVTSLNPGECVDAFATYQITQADIDAGLLHNIATVYGNPSYGDPNDRSDDVTSTAKAFLCLPQHAEICLDKVTVYGNQKGEHLHIPAGSAISWEYAVTNKGNVSLRDIALSDQLTGAISSSRIVSRSLNDDAVLDVGETWVYKVFGTAISDEYCSDGSVTGYYTDCDGNRQSASSTDWNKYIGYQPQSQCAGSTKKSWEKPHDCFSHYQLPCAGNYSNHYQSALC
jgi:uncharacterized repeat protein (TIGR01451 family)